MQDVPGILKSCAFVLASCATFLIACQAFSQGSFHGVIFVNFDMDKFFYLNITSLATDLIEDESECGFACLESSSCFSYNLAAFPETNGKLLCELLPSDKYNNSDKFASNQFFHHFSIPSPFSNWPCRNKGKCVPLYKENNHLCLCSKGFTGKNCETKVNECESNPCLNNGTCTDRVNGFNCSCSPGFTGERCEIDLLANECDSNPCRNNGTCSDRVNGFNCSCPQGFTGDICEFSDFTATFTCDNTMEMFADGRSLGKDNGNWGIAVTYIVPGDTRVLSVAGQDSGGGFGILGSFSNGLVTNESWRCNSALSPGWNSLDFDDQQWPLAVVVANHGDSPWGFITGISSKAKWIWTSGQYDDVYCRMNLR